METESLVLAHLFEFGLHYNINEYPLSNRTHSPIYRSMKDINEHSVFHWFKFDMDTV